MEQLLTKQEACALLGVKPRTLQDYMLKGLLPFVKLTDAPNGRVRFTREAVEAFVAKRTRGGRHG